MRRLPNPRGALVLLAALSSLPTGVAAQLRGEAPLRGTPTPSTRANARAQEDGAKAPAGQSGLTTWLKRRAESFGGSADESKDGFSVDAGVITPGAALGAGVGYRRSNLLSSGLGLEADAMVSYRRYQAYRVAVGFLGARRSTVSLNASDTRLVSLFNDAALKAPGAALYADVRFRDYPRHMYSGNGIESAEGDRSDYALTGLSYDGVFQKQIRRTLGFSVRGGLLNLDVGTGRDGSVTNFERTFNPSDVPGALTHPAFLTLAGGVVYDTRPEVRAPGSGAFVGLSLRRFHDRASGDSSFTRMGADARTYRRLGVRGIVAIRGLLSADMAGAARRTPFYLQESLGGGETLRGFRPLRFQDRALLHGTVEYRWRAHRFVEVAPFIDAGTVASALSRLGNDPWRFAGGIGLRARSDERMIIRLDWARSREGQRLILATGPFF